MIGGEYKLGDIIIFKVKFRRYDLVARILRFLHIADLMEPDMEPKIFEVSYIINGNENNHD